jgi:hypothetical protein
MEVQHYSVLSVLTRTSWHNIPKKLLSSGEALFVKSEVLKAVTLKTAAFLLCNPVDVVDVSEEFTNTIFRVG